MSAGVRRRATVPSSRSTQDPGPWTEGDAGAVLDVEQATSSVREAIVKHKIDVYVGHDTPPIALAMGDAMGVVRSAVTLMFEASPTQDQSRAFFTLLTTLAKPWA